MSGGLDGVRGTAFPFRIDPGTGRVAMTDGEAKIGDNIRLVIGTRLGERPMLREVRLRLDYVHANEQVAGSAILPLGSGETR